MGQQSGDEVREQVRQRYAAAALTITEAGQGACCSDTGSIGERRDGRAVFGPELYADAGVAGVEATALAGSLGCGVPTAVAELTYGEVVLDLGSGAGGDVLVSARRVGPTGRVYGLDMTTEMVELARANAAQAGVANVEFLQGFLEEVPLPDASVDVVISNCVINLAADKRVVLAEAARVTRPGGRFAVSDVVATEAADLTGRADAAEYAGCIVGALTEAEYESMLVEAGWRDVSVTRTHQVADQAYTAIIRATLG